MKILFVHQNFPGQFKHLAPSLALAAQHQIVALTMRQDLPANWQGVRIVPYGATRGSTAGVHPWVADFETKTIRGEAAFLAALQLAGQGFQPDVIVAHPGWGESLFLREVWPKARLGIYCEFFYHARGADVGFDPEFPVDPAAPCRMRMKNAHNLLHFDIAEAGLAPTQWQASTFPLPFRERIRVVHDGIDTAALAPHAGIELTLNGATRLTRADEVVTFVNRNLEPYRGYHIFMRSLPTLLRQRPQARVLIVGGDQVSYGARPPAGTSWKDIFAAEVRPQMSEAAWQRIHFLGNLPYDQFIALLQLSRVHVYLTYPFVLSWSLLEAMSLGCAIVASDTAPLHEAIRTGETGCLVNFFDHQALAQQVGDLLADHAACQQLGRQAREFARSTYDLQTVCLPRQRQWVTDLAGA